MKKILLLTLLVISAVNVQAQLGQLVSSNSRTLVTTERSYESMRYLRVGLNLASIAGDLEQEWGADKEGRSAGYYVGYGFNKTFAAQGLYWGMEFGLGSRGFKCKYEYDGQDDLDVESLIAHNIKVTPYMIGYKHEIVENIKLDLHFGSYLSYDYAGKYKYKDGYDSAYDEEISLSDMNDLLTDGYQRFDIGLDYGFGVWFNDAVNLDFSFQNGFVGMFGDWYGINGKTRNFAIRLGLVF